MKTKGAFPWLTLVPALVGLAYGESPVDLVPDIIPLLGWLDDALVVPTCVILTVWALLHRRKKLRSQPVPIESQTIR